MLDERRKAYLEAMGIDLWTSKNPASLVSSEEVAEVQPPVAEASPVKQDSPKIETTAPTEPPKPAAVTPPPAPAPEKPQVQANEATQEAPSFDDAYPGFNDEDDMAQQYGDEYMYLSGAAAEAKPVDDIASLDWGGLAERVAGCKKCMLCQTRTNTVFGVGSQTADLMIVGEAPGADEDHQGEPFVGRAGQLLTAMLGAIGFSREQVYIANILKCRPPNNRNPHVDEVAACQAYLNRQISLIRPKIILSVGGVSAHNLLHTDESVGRLRRQQHKYAPTNTPVLVTYHPAYLLRKPEEKGKVWEDLQKLYLALQQ